MDKELLAKLLEYIDARIDEKGPQTGSDEGLNDVLRVIELRKELEDMCDD